MDSQTVEENRSVTLKSNSFKRTNYVFTGWNTKADGSAKAYSDKATVKFSTNTTLYAQWKRQTVTVSFDSNGGTGVMPSQSVNKGETVSLDGNLFSKENYTFIGWNTKADGSGTSFGDGASVTFAANTILYAQWAQEIVTVTFNSNGGTGVMDVQNVGKGIGTALITNSFEREYYDFIGWNTKADGSAEAYSDKATVKFTTNTTLYAQWKRQTVTVSFDSNGGTGVMPSQSVNKGETVSLDGNLFSKENYTFIGWNTKADGSGTSFGDGASVTFTSNTVLYAQWAQEIVTVTFNSNGGTGVMDVQNVGKGTGTALIANSFEKEHYFFTGWNTESDGSGAGFANGASVTFTTNTVLYAQWREMAARFNSQELALFSDTEKNDGTKSFAESDADTFTSLILKNNTHSVSSRTNTKLIAEDDHTILMGGENSDWIVSNYVMDITEEKGLKEGAIECGIRHSSKPGSKAIPLFVSYEYDNETFTEIYETEGHTIVYNYNRSSGAESFSYDGSAVSGQTEALNLLATDLSVLEPNITAEALVGIIQGVENFTVSGTPVQAVIRTNYVYPDNSEINITRAETYVDSDRHGSGVVVIDATGADEKTAKVRLTADYTEGYIPDEDLIGEAFGGNAELLEADISGESFRLNNVKESSFLKIEDGNFRLSLKYGTLVPIDKSILTGDLEIPAKIRGRKVEKIGESAFRECSGLTSINIPDGVTSIGMSAFNGCSGLTSITIPDGVTSIGMEAFCGCSGLTSITIPDGVTNIADGVFSGCSGLTSITIPDGVTSIGLSAFRNCRGLTSINIPDGVTSINSYAFDGCSGLTSITIPDGVTRIGAYAFEYCSSLTSISIPDGVTSIGAYAFEYCSSLTSISIPDGVTSIERYTFGGCSGLTSITIPDGVTSIGESAFAGCRGLTSITIPDGVTSIERYTFGGCRGLTSITIPDGVTSIGWEAFYNCSRLTSITIPDGVTSIGREAFYNCSSLTSITIPDGVTSIDLSAFRNCRGLTSINIPDGVTSINSYAFDGCSGLTSITIPDGVTSIGNGAFRGCRGLTSITIPDGVTSIGLETFRQCSGLTSITIPDGVTSIGDCAFDSCRGLTSITIPDGVTSIGREAFRECSGFTSITIPDGVTSVGIYAFGGCSGLTSITIPDGVTSIERYTFGGCSGLTSITIPDGVTSIGESAFGGCGGLTSITFNGTKDQWNAISKGTNWKSNAPATVVHCTDGDVSL